MGTEASRLQSLPQHLDDEMQRKRIVDNWTVEAVQANHTMLNTWQGHTFLNPSTITRLGKILKTFFDELAIPVAVLEVMAGNCETSCQLQQFLQVDKWMTTDIIDLPFRIQTIAFTQCSSTEAVKRYGLSANVLLLICPTPGDTYADYYACVDFMEQTFQLKLPDRFIVCVGEIGAADGSIGMYQFLTEHKQLQLKLREKISCFVNPFNKEECYREAFVFKIKQPK